MGAMTHTRTRNALVALVVAVAYIALFNVTALVAAVAPWPSVAVLSAGAVAVTAGAVRFIR